MAIKPPHPIQSSLHRASPGGTTWTSETATRSSRSRSTSRPDRRRTRWRPPTRPSAAAPASIGDGTYVVGTDIKPGLYKTSGPADASIPICYWERDRDLSGGIGSIIANDNSNGPTTVQISSSDRAFKTSGCATWVKIG